MDGLSANQGNAHEKGLVSVVQPEVDAFQAQTFNLVGPQVGTRVDAVEEDLGPCLVSHGAHVEVIKIQNSDPFRGWRQGLNQLGFAAGNFSQIQRLFSVRPANVGQDAYGRQS